MVSAVEKQFVEATFVSHEVVLIAEDAGENVVGQLLKAASDMGFKYKNKTENIKRLSANGIEFATCLHAQPSNSR